MRTSLFSNVPRLECGREDDLIIVVVVVVALDTDAALFFHNGVFSTKLLCEL